MISCVGLTLGLFQLSTRTQMSVPWYESQHKCHSRSILFYCIFFIFNIFIFPEWSNLCLLSLIDGCALQFVKVWGRMIFFSKCPDLYVIIALIDLFVYWISDLAEQFKLQENNYPNQLALLRGFFFWLQVTTNNFVIGNNLGKLVCVGKHLNS